MSQPKNTEMFRKPTVDQVKKPDAKRFENESQNLLMRATQKEVAKFKDRLPVRVVRDGDTPGALARSLNGGKLDYSMAVDYRSNKTRPYRGKLPEKLSEVNFIKEGQFMWIENGKFVIDDIPPMNKAPDIASQDQPEIFPSGWAPLGQDLPQYDVPPAEPTEPQYDVPQQ
ncbi:MAG: hypothetical protein V2A63_00145 [Patescibacteria group bacterium]